MGRVDVKDVPGRAKDTVTETLPAAGQQVAPGTSINIVVASGEILIDESVTSKIIGQTREAAEAYLNDTLKISSITVETEENQAFTEGTISRMEPMPGKVPFNTKVTLWVAKKPAERVPAPSQPGTGNGNGSGNGGGSHDRPGSNDSNKPRKPGGDQVPAPPEDSERP